MIIPTALPWPRKATSICDALYPASWLLKRRGLRELNSQSVFMTCLLLLLVGRSLDARFGYWGPPSKHHPTFSLAIIDRTIIGQIWKIFPPCPLHAFQPWLYQGLRRYLNTRINHKACRASLAQQGDFWTAFWRIPQKGRSKYSTVSVSSKPRCTKRGSKHHRYETRTTTR